VPTATGVMTTGDYQGLDHTLKGQVQFRMTPKLNAKLAA
jgi:hypothetical protein